MKGLLIKDLYTLKRYALYYAIYCAAFTLLAVFLDNPAFVTGLAMLLPLSATAAVVTCDRKDDWTAYSLACGLSPSVIAAEKYIVSLAFSAVSVALWPLAYFLSAPPAVELSGLAMTAALSLAVVALSVPLAYKFGAERGRLLLGIIALALLAAAVALMTAFGDGIAAAPAYLLALPPAGCAAACVGSFFVTRAVIRNL